MHISKISDEREVGYHIDQLIRTIWIKKDTERQSDGYFHMHNMYCLDDDCSMREDLSSLKLQDQCAGGNNKKRKRGARSYMI